jgi:RNA polymerase sigma-70 factor (ECF subfamily)
MDEILVKKTLSGDKAAFNELVAKYQTQVYGLAFNISRNFSDAEDLAQEAFLRAYLSLHQLREPAKFGNWLYKITQNICRRWLQKKTNHEEMT